MKFLYLTLFLCYVFINYDLVSSQKRRRRIEAKNECPEKFDFGSGKYKDVITLSEAQQVAECTDAAITDLYYKPTCPYSLKVLNYMKDQGIELEKDGAAMKVTRGQDNALTEHGKELAQQTGRTQVPALKIGQYILFESDDIVKMLELVYQDERQEL